jgi:hypothetical protein
MAVGLGVTPAVDGDALALADALAVALVVGSAGRPTP